MSSTKPFGISKQQVWEAWKCVKANKGSAGIDLESIEDFESNLSNNLYKLWNRMSSGSYFPPPVMRIPIAKKSGGTRILGVPTVGDRVAQTVAKKCLEAVLEPVFLPDSYGYRPGKSALDAVAITRKRCWKHKWVLEFDVQGLFDNIRHDLLNKALSKHINTDWILLYVNRWLVAPMQEPGKAAVPRTMGTPQGGCVSSVLSNLFLHYVFDTWMRRHYPKLQWCRYVDDGLVHCSSRYEAEKMLRILQDRFGACGLKLHPGKTRIVCCDRRYKVPKDCAREFTFLGYTFRMRKTKAQNSSKIFDGFQPAISGEALKSIRRQIKYDWKLKSKTYLDLEHLANWLNPVIRGWFNYYGRHYKGAMVKLARFVNEHIRLWATHKYQKLWRHRIRSYNWLKNVYKCNPKLFVHWKEYPVY